MKKCQDKKSESLQDQEKKVLGRPTLANAERKKSIIDGISKGTPLTVICRDLGICDDTVRDWMKVDDDFSRDIACARILGFDAIAMDALSIADDTSNDTILIGKEGSEYEAPNKEWIARSKLRVETRLKLLAKWDPKRYGDMMRQEISGPDGAPITTQSNRTEQEKAEFAILLAKAQEKLK